MRRAGRKKMKIITMMIRRTHHSISLTETTREAEYPEPTERKGEKNGSAEI